MLRTQQDHAPGDSHGRRSVAPWSARGEGQDATTNRRGVADLAGGVGSNDAGSRSTGVLIGSRVVEESSTEAWEGDSGTHTHHPRLPFATRSTGCAWQVAGTAA